ncbi:hypothetical protein MASR2M70_02590 [Bacillota bacterium]
MLALQMVTLFITGFVPGIELTLYALSSFYASVIIIETNIKAGILFYFASSLLAMLIIPNKSAVLPYIFFFGAYAIIKFFIEKIGKQIIEIPLKLLAFNICIGAGIILFKSAFLGNISLPEYSNMLLIPAAQLMFLLYDYIFTLLIAYYRRRFSKLR